jgi:hypothetical protein
MPRHDSGAEPEYPDYDAEANRIGPRVERALQRLRGVFLQAPDARLSLADAVRVAGLEAHLCRVLLNALEDLRFLKRGQDGLYRRHAAKPGESS